MRCDWYIGSDDFYEDDQITVELIEKIKKSIMRNEDNGPYNIYAAYDDANWLQMLWLSIFVTLVVKNLTSISDRVYRIYKSCVVIYGCSWHM